MAIKPFLPSVEELTKAREIIQDQLDKDYWPDMKWIKISDSVWMALYAKGAGGDFFASLYPSNGDEPDKRFLNITFLVL